MSTLGKCFVTFAAGKRLFVSMESLVNNKLSASHEFLFTVFALKCFHSISSFLMTSKVFLRFERSSTFWTGILLSNIMDVLVAPEVLLLFKCFLTNCTCKRRLIGVHYLVTIQICCWRKRFVTLRTVFTAWTLRLCWLSLGTFKKFFCTVFPHFHWSRCSAFSYDFF